MTPSSDRSEALIRLDIPIPPKEARSRNIARELSRLVVEVKSGADAKSLVAQIVERCRPGNRATFTAPIGEFVTLDARHDTLRGTNIRYFPKLNIARSASADDTAALLADWRAERLVLFYSDDETAGQIVSSATKLIPKWWQLSRGSDEGLFLQQLTYSDPFLFYSESLSSLEILGSRNAVLAFFNASLELTYRGERST